MPSESTSLHGPIASLFNDSQLSAANHRRNCISLHKIHNSRANSRSSSSLEWESQFFFEFFNCVAICLDLRKNEEIAQRLCKFINSYCLYSKEKDTIGIHSRFMDNLIACLLHGTEAKDKQIRQRSCILLGGTMAAVDELRSELLSLFISQLTHRLYDKEQVVRAAALEALARIQDLDPAIKAGICQLLQFDPSAEVRKTALATINVDESSLDLIIARTQDESPIVRKLWFKKKALEISFTSLSIKQRELILKNGLFDRDPSVKEACVEMIFSLWLPQTGSNIIQFLDALDVISNTQIALEALKGFFCKYPSLFTKFPDAYFEALTADTAFIMRSYCEFVLVRGESAVQDLLPEVIQFATFLKAACEALLSPSSASDADLLELEFIAIQMFSIGRLLDYSDEVSRRFMISLLHDVLSVPTVPLACIPEVVQFLFVLSPDPRERVGIFGEILMELVEENVVGNSSNSMHESSLQSDSSLMHESSMESNSIHPSKEATAQKEAALVQQLKCLQILNEFIKESPALAFDQHPILAAFFNELVIPSINSPLAVIQEAGLECLGAYCLLYKPLALEYLGLIVDFFRMGHVEIKVIALKILFDAEIQFTMTNEACFSCFHEALAQQAEELGVVAVEGVCKLLLVKPASTWNVETLNLFLGNLLARYFDREGGKCPKVRQCLAYFFSVYATANAAALLPHFIPILQRTLEGYNNALEASTSDEQSAKPLQVADQMLFWMGISKSCDLAVDLAMELLLACMNALVHKHSNKAFLRLVVTVLNRLPALEASIDVGKVKRLDYLATALLRKIGNGGDKLVVAGLRKFIASYVEFDDRSVRLASEEIEELQRLVDRANSKQR
jgi:condensin complex subunit 3